MSPQHPEPRGGPGQLLPAEGGEVVGTVTERRGFALGETDHADVRALGHEGGQQRTEPEGLVVGVGDQDADAAPSGKLRRLPRPGVSSRGSHR